jgi:hypothetical protein
MYREMALQLRTRRPSGEWSSARIAIAISHGAEPSVGHGLRERPAFRKVRVLTIVDTFTLVRAIDVRFSFKGCDVVAIDKRKGSQLLIH